jgi:hypothetical protein
MEAEALSLIIRARTHPSSRRTLSHWAGCVNILPTDPSHLNRGAYIIHTVICELSLFGFILFYMGFSKSRVFFFKRDPSSSYSSDFSPSK